MGKTMNTSAKIIIFCYLIFSPTVLSMALPDPQTFGQLDALEERTIEIPDNVLEAAAVGFLAGRTVVVQSYYHHHYHYSCTYHHHNGSIRIMKGICRLLTLECGLYLEPTKKQQISSNVFFKRK